MKKNQFAICALLLLFLPFARVEAQALFSQYRVIFEKDGIMTLYLSNPTEETYTYKITFEDKKMNQSGKVEPVAQNEKFDQSLKSYLRVFPRNVAIKPGGSQEVQIQVKTPEGLAEGEYRSFITFTPLQGNQNAKQDPLTSDQGTQMSVKFQMASAIPVIYRKNPVVQNVSIAEVALQVQNDSISNLNLRLERQGNRSIYGAIQVIGTVKGIPTVMEIPNASAVIYCEIPGLDISLPVNLKKFDRTPTGKVVLDIAYIDQENIRAKNPRIWAQKKVELMVPKRK
ncbi:MAG: WxL protein peptidoglycan domain-containing protein [Bacteroidales bacterium]